jgi:F-type H+-transporting ATPase subunit delta
MDRRVAKRYAAAIFNSAVKADCVKATEEDLKSIVAIFFGNEDFKDFLLSPKARREDKVAFLVKVLHGHIAPLTLDTVRFLIEKRRDDEIPLISEEFEILRRAQEKVLYVKISSISELTAAQRKAILEKLARKLGRTIEPEFAIDTTLVGGIRVAYENMVLDGSVRGGLARLASILNYDLLKQA